MSRDTDGGRTVQAETIGRCLDRQERLAGYPWLSRALWLACERISRQGLSTGPGEREGCSALNTLDNRPGLVLSDGTAEMEALKDAVDGPELKGEYVSTSPVKRQRKSRKR